MAQYNSYMLMKQRIAQQMEWLKRRSAEGASGSDEKIQMIETRLYVGLNDAETKEQILETEQYLQQLKNLCFTYHVPFSVGIEEGGYFHDNGDYVEEKTLVLTLIDADKDTIRKIAEDLRVLFHQESVLLTEDVVRGCYIEERH